MAREGCRWRGLPDEFGYWQTLYQRFRRWHEQGVFDLLSEIFISKYYVGMLMVDGTIVPVHQDATGARKSRGTPEDQAIGISRGGRTTKILAACDEHGNPIAVMLLPGHAGESPNVEELVGEIEANEFIGDKAYDSDKLLEYFQSRGIKFTVPPRSNRRFQRYHDKVSYKERRLIENVFQRIKRYRHIFTRYDKHSEHYMAFIIFVMVHLLTRTKESKLREVTVIMRKRRVANEIYVPEGLVREAKRAPSAAKTVA